jgi:hypothetical protein
MGKLMLASSCLSIHLCMSPSLPLGGCPWNLILGTFMKVCQENLLVWNVCKKIQIWLKVGKNIEYITWELRYVLLLLVILNHHESALVRWNGIRLLHDMYICLVYRSCTHCWRTSKKSGPTILFVLTLQHAPILCLCIGFSRIDLRFHELQCVVFCEFTLPCNRNTATSEKKFMRMDFTVVKDGSTKIQSVNWITLLEFM